MEEEKTITIEIRQEVAVMLTCIVVGVILVTAAFLVPDNSPELWPALTAGAIVAVVYLLGVLIYTTRKPVSSRARTLMLLTSIVILGASVFSWFVMKDQAEWQKSKLLEIRGMIGQGVVQACASDCLLNALQAYYQQKNVGKESLGQIFQKQNNGAVQGSNIRSPSYEGDSLRIYVQQIEPYRIVLVSQDPVGKGRNGEFVNYAGRKGLAQLRFTLTTKGMTYESEN